MIPLKVYILEDEMITQEVLKQTLESLNCKVIGMQSNAEKALSEIESLSPDFAFLDIRVEGTKTGIWLGNQLNIPIVYLTAFSDDKNVRNAVLTNPVSYLQKPFQEKDIFIALELVKQKLKEVKEIIVKENNISVKVSADDILYAKKEDHYLVLTTTKGDKLIRATIAEFLEMVTKDFVQVHRSFIINKNFVSAFTSKKIEINDIEIPVSTSFSSTLKELF